MNLAYLSSPYSGSHFKQTERYWHAVHLAAKLSSDYAVYSNPIMRHALGEFFARDHEAWVRQGLNVLARSDLLVLAPLPGWRDSLGLRRELSFQRHHGIRLIVLQGFEDQFEHLEMEDFERLGGGGVKFL